MQYNCALLPSLLSLVGLQGYRCGGCALLAEVDERVGPDALGRLHPKIVILR